MCHMPRIGQLRGHAGRIVVADEIPGPKAAAESNVPLQGMSPIRRSCDR